MREGSRQERMAMSEQGREDEEGAGVLGLAGFRAPLMLWNQERALEWELACGRRDQVLGSITRQAAESPKGEITDYLRGVWEGINRSPPASRQSDKARWRACHLPHAGRCRGCPPKLESVAGWWGHQGVATFPRPSLLWGWRRAWMT